MTKPDNRATARLPRSVKDFEKAFRELESIAQKMESGNLSLEESLLAFERGVLLSRTCQEGLAAAEQRVRELSASFLSKAENAAESESSSHTSD